MVLSALEEKNVSCEKNNGGGESCFCRVGSGKVSWRRYLWLLEEKPPACEECVGQSFRQRNEDMFQGHMARNSPFWRRNEGHCGRGVWGRVGGGSGGFGEAVPCGLS